MASGQVPKDPDVDRETSGQPREPLVSHVLTVIALGGVVGAEARYGLSVGLSHGPSGWPWSTLLTNTSGSLLIGVLVVVITEMRRTHPLVRPFLTVGVLGGYTTFSTYTADAVVLWQGGRFEAASGYVVITPVAAVLACLVGVVVTRSLARRGWTAGAEDQR
jgi:fluoride exporter